MNKPAELLYHTTPPHQEEMLLNPPHWTFNDQQQGLTLVSNMESDHFIFFQALLYCLTVYWVSSHDTTWATFTEKDIVHRWSMCLWLELNAIRSIIIQRNLAVMFTRTQFWGWKIQHLISSRRLHTKKNMPHNVWQYNFWIHLNEWFQLHFTKIQKQYKLAFYIFFKHRSWKQELLKPRQRSFKAGETEGPIETTGPSYQEGGRGH